MWNLEHHFHVIFKFHFEEVYFIFKMEKKNINYIGNHKIETNTKATLDRTKNKAIFNEVIGIKASLYFDTKKGKYYG